jgi:hypothetical protein
VPGSPKRLQKRVARRFDSVAKASTVIRQPMDASVEETWDHKEEETEGPRMPSRFAPSLKWSPPREAPSTPSATS